MLGIPAHLTRRDRNHVVLMRVLVMVLILVVLGSGFFLWKYYESADGQASSTTSCGQGADTPAAAVTGMVEAAGRHDWSRSCVYTDADEDEIRTIMANMPRFSDPNTRTQYLKDNRAVVELFANSDDSNADDGVTWSFTTFKHNGSGSKWIVAMSSSTTA